MTGNAKPMARRLPADQWRPITAGHCTTAPVSYGQRALWLFEQLHPGTATYHVPWVALLHGVLDPTVVAEALTHIVERHESLRTGFALRDGEPCQVIRPPAPIPVPVDDLRDASVDKAVEHFIRQPFDLEHGPLLRARLIRTGDADWMLVIVLHHLACDEWALGVFERELVHLCGPERAFPGPPPPIQYADYASWQRGTDQAARLDSGLDRWRQRLSGVPGELDLPTDRPRPVDGTFAGATTYFEIPDAVTAGVRRLAQENGATPFMVLLAGLAALVHRYTGVDDLVIGSPTAGRNRPELESLVGFFVNLLPLRIRPDGGVTFRDLIARVRDDVLDDLSHADVPFELISQSVQVVFGLHREQPYPLRIGKATGSRGITSASTAKFEMIWSVFDDGQRLRGEVEFRTDLFDAATVDRMAAQWLRLLDGAARAPLTPLSALPLLTGADLAIVSPRATEPKPPERAVHQCFEAIAEVAPDRTAVVGETSHLTYRELNERSNRLTHCLRDAHGVRSGDRVGLLVGRTVRLVETTVAVLKAGAAYVPLNPADSPDRISMALTDAAVGVVLTDDPQAVPPGGWRIVDLSTTDTTHCPQENVGLPYDPEAAAYVIFTSGSTGRPKGVEVTHRNVAALFDATIGVFGYGPEDVWTLFHSHAFDFSVWELWGPLVSGGSVVVVPYETSRSPEAFAELVEGAGVTMLSQTPSALAQLAGALRARPRTLERLRWVVLGGEALQPQQVRQWFAAAGPRSGRLCNMYGITETTVHVTWHPVEPGSPYERSIIGRPLPHLRVAVLDRYGNLAPIGVPGEVFVGGAGVARGYVGRPEEAARRFPLDPFADEPGQRGYRSGDLARWLADGTLEYLGRADRQLKIRGFRIEPGEVQSVLTEHPDVTACVVAPFTDTDGELRLAAYVETTRPAAATELRRHLRERLPDYMVPAAVVFLTALPVTSSGKVDFRALPVPGQDDGSRDHVAPRDEREELLATVWAETLNTPAVGATDNFFELGGDSIRAVQIAGRLRAYGFEVPVGQIFATPVLADLAATLNRPDSGASGDTADEPFALLDNADRALVPPGVEDAYPMTEMQLAMVYHMELDPERRPYHNVNSYRVESAMDTEAFTAAVAEVTRRHAVLRTSLDISRFSEPMQLVYRNVRARLSFADIRGQPEAQQRSVIADLVEREFADVFTIGEPPLFRLAVHALTDDSFQLTVTEHHAILDGWSFTSLLAEILTRHNALRDKPGSPPRPPPRSSFCRFVAAERAAMASEETGAFWRDRLAGFDGRLFDVEQAGSTAAYGTVERVIPTEVFASVHDFAATLGVGVKSCALAAHLVGLAGLTGSPRVATGVVVNGRLEEAGGTQAYGAFLNILPLWVDLTGLSWRALGRHLHDEETAMLPHRRYPFPRLSRLLQNPRLDSDFVFNRFHSLARLQKDDVRISDDRIGCEPMLRREPNHVHFGVAVMQDPTSHRALLAVDYTTALVPEAEAQRFTERVLAGLAAMTRTPDALPDREQ